MGVGSASVVDYANTYPGTASHVNATGSVGDFEVVVDGSGATTLNLNFQTTTTLDPRITFTRASSATQYNSTGTLISVGSNDARFDYDPATLAPKGLLIEESRTNLAWPSITPTASTGTLLIGTGITTKVANASVAPDGTTTATSYTSVQGNSNSSTGSSIRNLNGITTAGTYTFSFFSKASVGGFTASVKFIDSGAVLDTTVACSAIDGGNNTVTTAWRRYYATVTVPAGSTNFYAVIVFGSNTDTTFVWGAQLEAGSFATSYIPTTSAQVTRAADNASMVGTNFSSWYNQSEGTIYSQWMLGGDNTSDTVYSINDATSANYIRCRYNSAGSGNDNAIAVSGIVQQTLTATNQMALYAMYKNAMAYKQNDFARSANGTLITGSTGNIPVVSQMIIGVSESSVNQLNGHIQSIKYYPKRLPNGTLQGLTS